jgi:hypothetical protein
MRPNLRAMAPLASAQNLCVVERMLMGQQEHCADKLLMVAEMLEAASEYLTVCRGLPDDQDPVMARLAYEHVLNLKNQLGQLNRKLDALEMDLRRKLIAAREQARDHSPDRNPDGTDDSRDRAQNRVIQKTKAARGGA